MEPFFNRDFWRAVVAGLFSGIVLLAILGGLFWWWWTSPMNALPDGYSTLWIAIGVGVAVVIGLPLWIMALRK